jgi:AcrR family transcriptional regulator
MSPRRADGEVTRRRVLDAAIQSILERGYYASSSNEIARRAGVTWGTIQHQFGTREALLLEVMNERWRRLEEYVGTVRVEGSTLEERLGSILDILASHYGHPDHLAHLQILLDLSHDPATSATTRAAIAVHGVELAHAWKPLFDQALGEAAADEELVRYAFLTLRGYLTGQLISSSITQIAPDGATRHLLVRGMAGMIAEQAAERGMDVG